MRYQLEVFDSTDTQIGSLLMLVGAGSSPSKPFTLLWQWQGKGGSTTGTWEWKNSGDWRIVLSKLSQDHWGTLYGDWKSLPTAQPAPVMPWFSKRGVKSGDMRVITPANWYNATWELL